MFEDWLLRGCLRSGDKGIISQRAECRFIVWEWDIEGKGGEGEIYVSVRDCWSWGRGERRLAYRGFLWIWSGGGFAPNFFLTVGCLFPERCYGAAWLKITFR